MNVYLDNAPRVRRSVALRCVRPVDNIRRAVFGDDHVAGLIIAVAKFHMAGKPSTSGSTSVIGNNHYETNGNGRLPVFILTFYRFAVIIDA